MQNIYVKVLLVEYTRLKSEEIKNVSILWSVSSNDSNIGSKPETLRQKNRKPLWRSLEKLNTYVQKADP